MNREEWYAVRDDRTGRNLHAGPFSRASAAIIVDSEQSETYDCQLMLTLAASMLSRWCRRIKIEIPAVPSVLAASRGRDIREVVLSEMRAADPFGEFSCGKVDESEFDQILLVGKPPRNLEKSATWINGSGWIAGVGRGVAPSILLNGRNPVGPAFAACLGVAEIFKLACGSLAPAPYAAWTSLFDYSQSNDRDQLQNPALLTSASLGKLDVVGCGAIGSSYIYLAKMAELPGHFRLIDFDVVSASNCSSSLIFSYESASAEIKKVQACAESLRSTSITSESFEESYSKFVATGKPFDSPPDIILCFANEQNIWATIQKNMPPLVLHATTTPSWGLNFGRHIPGREWCILCRFGESNTGYKPLCAVGEVVPALADEKPILASLPFLSPASAAVALAETLKLVVGAPANPENFLQFSMKPIGAGGRFMLASRVADTDCACRALPIAYYPESIRKTRFWPK